MSPCAHRDEILEPGALDRAPLRDHVAGCEDCRSRLALQHEVYARLDAGAHGLDAAALAGVWARIEQAREPRWRAWAWAPLLAAALGVVAVMVFRASPAVEARLLAGKAHDVEGVPETLALGSRLPRERWVELDAGARIEVAGARLSATRVARLSVVDDAVWVASGALALEVDAEALVLVTPAARVKASDARFSVEVSDAALEVAVIAGAVAVVTPKAERAAAPGETVRVARSASPPSAGASPGSAVDGRARPAADPARAVAGRGMDASAEVAREPARALDGARTNGARAAAPSPHAAPQAAPASAAPPPAITPSPATDDLADARRLLGREDRRAAALADAVVARAPESVEALLVAADARRRQRLWGDAERLYARASTHADSAAFLEEALLRLAETQAALGRTADALASLAAATARAPTRALLPERAALEATLRLAVPDASGAARALTAVATSNDRVLDRPRLAVARALLALTARPDAPPDSSPEATARALLAPLVDRRGSTGDAARALVREADRARARPDR